MKFSIKQIITALGVIIFLGLIVFAAFWFKSANTQNPNSNENKVAERNEQTQTSPSQPISYSLSLKKEQRGITSISYPVMSGFANSKIQNSFNELAKQTVESKITLSASETYPPLWYEAVESNIVNQSENFASILISANAYKGGAHDIGVEYSAFNYDLENNKLLKLQDIFKENANYLNILSEATYNALIAKYDEQTYGSGFRSGTAPEEKNFDAVTFDESSFQVYFDDYQVGSYADAIVGPITIPYETIKDSLNPQSMIVKQYLY